MAALVTPTFSALEKTAEATVEALPAIQEEIKHLKVRYALHLSGRNNIRVSVCSTEDLASDC